MQRVLHLDGELANLPLNTIPHLMPQLPGGGEGTAPDVDPMGYHSKVFLYAPGMPKIAGEGGVGILPGPVLM